MGRTCFLFVIVLLHMFHSSQYGHGKEPESLGFVRCKKHELEALLKFKQSFTKDPLNRLTSWVGEDCCQWHGVTCDNITNNVVKLNLRAMPPHYNYFDDDYGYDDNLDNIICMPNDDVSMVSSGISPALLELKLLTYLDLSGNYFYGSHIPEFIGSLTHLRYLNLSSANFFGLFPPQLGNLTNLVHLDLHVSYTSGDIYNDDFKWGSSLIKLQSLDMSGYDLSRSHDTFKVLSTLPSLSALSLSRCELHNSHLSEAFAENTSGSFFPTLQHLDLSSNAFEGPLPSIFKNMVSLRSLSLSYNRFNGSVPFWLRTMRHLEVLDLSSNFFNYVEGGIMGIMGNTSGSYCELHNSHLSEAFYTGNTSGSFFPTLQHLDLSSNAFEGPLPSIFKNMVSLRSLSLSHNHFNGSVPLWLRAMSHLEFLDVSMNQFSYVEGGILGIMGNPCNFKHLDLSNNFIFQGDFLEPLMGLSGCAAFELQYLALSYNMMNGKLPSSLGQLTNLNYLDLCGTSMNGSLPSSMGKLTNLNHLDLSYNEFKGGIPASFVNLLSTLTYLDLSNNKLSGLIPDFIRHLTRIKHLDISSNSFHGTFFGIGNLSKLSYLDLSLNHLNLNLDSSLNWRPPFQLRFFIVRSCVINTVFPQWLRNQTQIEFLDLSDTGISGELPKWLWNSSSLQSILLSGNRLTGSLPHHIACDGPYYSCNIWWLDLHNNLLTGTIPKWLGNLEVIQVIDLSSNLLTGEVFDGKNASSLFNIGNFLMVLDLSDNMLSGEIQFGMVPLSHIDLQILSLRGNHFSGPIRSQLCELKSLLVLQLNQNCLTGKIPHCLGSIGFDRVIILDNALDIQIIETVKGIVEVSTGTTGFSSIIDLSSNYLVSTIPEELTNISALFALNLSYNHLTGYIPENIGNLGQIESLDLSNNHLTGTIPQSLSSISWLSKLNLSNNNLHGPIPTGSQLQTLDDPSIYAGNSGLCGFPLPNCTKPDPPPSLTNVNPTAGKHNVEKEDKYDKMWFILAVMSGVATGFWGVVGTLVIKRSWRQAYFRYVEDLGDRIYVPVKVRVNRFKRRFNENS
ncbi:receptor-like protein EIX2 [Silene latifolia]|uniref:receptor-like protein EIX2 n=1 Tax=Silene latifolia TaxID=37657 RepID=UPI003D78B153